MTPDIRDDYLLSVVVKIDVDSKEMSLFTPADMCFSQHASPLPCNGVVLFKLLAGVIRYVRDIVKANTATCELTRGARDLFAHPRSSDLIKAAEILKNCNGFWTFELHAGLERIFVES